MSDPVIIDLTGGRDTPKEEPLGFMSKKTKELLDQSSALEQELEELETDNLKQSEQAAEVQEIQQALEADPEEKSFKKRYGDLRTHQNAKQKEFEESSAVLREEIETLKVQLSEVSSTQLQIPSNNEEFETWVSEFPQAAKMMETIAQQKVGDIKNEYDTKFSELEADKAKLSREREEETLKSLHSDWEDVRASDEFHDWAEAQPEVIKDILYGSKLDARAVATVVSSFKAQTVVAQITKQATTRAEAAEMVTTSSTPTEPRPKTKKIWKESDIDKMSLAEYELNMADIDKAMANGSLVYDLQD